ncbi:MAG TPA: TonB-dependent receptor [Puia sp.]|jgi:TonB-linked SusC/RagA family outer membrane protein
MKPLLLVSLAIFLHSTLFAQTAAIKGRVVDDSTGMGIPDVTVLLSGGGGTSTASDGSFMLPLPADGRKHTLAISYTGYASQNMSATGGAPLVIRLKRQMKDLEDVVVIGYQSVRRRDVLASVSSVSSKQLHDIPLNSAEEALAGRLAGVQVTGSEGSPNATVMIRVRGGGSITQDNSPLYVVDGIQVDNALSTLSVQDIESIDVLKDAASTAIYGARGANGVVIITTKGGHNTGGKTTIAYNGFVGISHLSKELQVMSPYEYMYYQYEKGQAGDTTGIAPYGNSWTTVENAKKVPAYDWQKKLLGRNAFQQTHNVSVSGGNENTQYNLSATANRQDAIMLLSNFDRKLVNFRLDHKASDRVKLGFNVRYNNTVVNGAGTSNPGSSSLNFLRQVMRYRPFLLNGQDDSYDPSYYLETNSNSLALVNPVLLNQQQYRRNYTSILNTNAYINYSFTKWLSFRSTFGYDNNSVRLEAFDDTLSPTAKSTGGGLPMASISYDTKETIDNSNVFTFTNAAMTGRFKEHNDITFIAGEETYQTREKTLMTQTLYFPIGTASSAAIANMNLGTPPVGGSEPKPLTTDLPVRLLSFFGRMSYAFEKKYLASLSFRADGSSLFGSEHRWGYFPSATAAWRISQEKFMENLGWVNDLKLRVSYGAAGNNRINPFQYSLQYVANSQYGLNDNLVTAFSPQSYPNGALKWETTVSRNAGVDASLFNNRLGITVDYYSNTTSDLLVNLNIPTSTGYTKQLQNVGSTTNKGVELQLSGTIIQGRGFSWTSLFNISFNKNKITDLGPVNSYLVNSGWAGSSNPEDYIVQVGQPVGAMYGLKTGGFYKTSDFNYDASTRTYTLKPGVSNSSTITSGPPMPGSLKYAGIGLKGDSVITPADRTIIGYAQPKFFGGFGQQLNFGRWDASVFINFQYGNKVYNYNKLEFASGYTSGANLIGVMANRWRTVDANGALYEQVVNGQVIGASPDSLNALNKNAKIWIPLVGASSASFYPQSWAVEDASFIRINNVTLGYSLPPSVTSKLKIARIRIYATVNNLAVITHYTGYDPEVNTRRDTPVTPGVDYSAYPRSRTYLAGVNVTF